MTKNSNGLYVHVKRVRAFGTWTDMGPNFSTVTLDVNGQHVTLQKAAGGPVESAYAAIKEIVPHKASLTGYKLIALTEGPDAAAEVKVELTSERGGIFAGKSNNGNILVASVDAYLDALNELRRFEEKRELAADHHHASIGTPINATATA